MSDQNPELPIEEIKKKDTTDDGGNAANEKVNAAQINQTINSAAPNLPPTHNHETDGHKKTYSCRENIKFFVEILGIIGGIIGVIFLIAQYQEMVIATNATKDAIVVAQQQLAEMKIARELGERAWVMPFDYEPEYTSNGFFVRVFFKNTGKTPAIDCEGHIYWQTNRDKIPPFDVRPPPPENRSLLAPDEGGIIDSPVFSLQDLAGIANGSKPVFYYGTIWYDDIFGNHHWSQFCRIFGPSAQVGFLKSYSLTIHNLCDGAQTNQTN